jgi:hypothetical protein
MGFIDGQLHDFFVCEEPHIGTIQYWETPQFQFRWLRLFQLIPRPAKMLELFGNAFKLVGFQNFYFPTFEFN